MSRQLFSVSSIWERKAKLTCLIRTFSNQSKLAEKKKEIKNLLKLKVTEFQSKVNLQKKPHPSSMKWECSSWQSQNIPCFCRWTFGSEIYHWDSNGKSRLKPRYHKLSQESLESSKKRKKKGKKSKWAALVFLSITSKSILNHIILVII